MTENDAYVVAGGKEFGFRSPDAALLFVRAYREEMRARDSPLPDDDRKARVNDVHIELNPTNKMRSARRLW